MRKYKELVKSLAANIPKLKWRHITRQYNRLADAYAFIPSMMTNPNSRYIKIQTLSHPAINKAEEQVAEEAKENGDEKAETSDVTEKGDSAILIASAVAEEDGNEIPNT